MYTVYLLRFRFPYWRNCRNYIGYTSKTLAERIATHRAGNGSKLVAYTLRNGNDFDEFCVSRHATQQEARSEEKRLKHNGHYDYIYNRLVGAKS